MTTILVIPDSHAKPDSSLERFKWLGKFIADVQPNYVVDIGDSADMNSLCKHSSTREQRLASYREDIQSYQKAQELLWEPLRSRKRKMPKRFKTQGNHEHRISKFVEEHPLWEGVISERDLDEAAFGWEVYPFLQPVEIEGIDFCHYYPSGVLNKPIGGDHPAYQILKKRFKSSVSGHDHRFDFKVLRSTGRSLYGLVSGCYLEDNMAYAGPANALWSSGVSLLEVIAPGEFDLNWISINRLKSEYAT